MFVFRQCSRNKPNSPNIYHFPYMYRTVYIMHEHVKRHAGLRGDVQRPTIRRVRTHFVQGAWNRTNRQKITQRTVTLKSPTVQFKHELIVEEFLSLSCNVMYNLATNTSVITCILCLRFERLNGAQDESWLYSVHLCYF